MNKFLVLFLLLGKLSFAQASYDKIIFLDEKNKEVTSESYKIKRVIKDYNLEKDCYRILDYDASNFLTAESTCANKYTFSRNGDYNTYYENGTKKSAKHYYNSNPEGKYEEWYEDGKKRLEGEYLPQEGLTERYRVLQFWNLEGKQEVINGNGYFNYEGKENSIQGNIVNGLKDGIWKGSYTSGGSFSEIYENGKFITGESIDDEGNKNVYTEFESKPEPKKGLQQFYKYIGNNFRYTSASIKNKISGKIIIQFIVDKDGKLVEPMVVKSLGYGLDEEAIRVLLSYEKWKPGQQRGRNVRVQYALPITLQGGF